MALAAMTFARPSLQFDRERIEMGNTFGLQLVFPLQELPETRSDLRFDSQNGFSLVKIDSTDQTMRPEVDPFEAFFGGSRARAYKARVYTFTLKAPKKTGRISAGAIYLTIDGQERNISGDIPVNIQRAFADDAVTISVTPSKKSVYEGEQFSVNLGIHTYEHFEGNLQATDMNTGNDFIVHRSDLANMKFEPVPNTRRDLQASAKFAWLSPTKSGNLQIPAFKFKYTKLGEPKVVEEKKQMGNMSFSSRSVKQESVEAEATSPSVNITVKPLPDGKPENFSGMVGNYSFNADFDRTKLKVGEALTLSINIKGDGLPGSITDPKLPDFSDFRSVPPENSISKKVVGNKVITSKAIKVFLYPKKKGEFTIPEIKYSWFNPSKKKYETAVAGPWNIEVEKGEAPAEAIFQAPVASAGNGPVAVQKKEIESLGNDIRFIHKVSGTPSNNAPYKCVAYWILFAAAVPFYFIVTCAVKRSRKHNSNAALVRKGKANKQLKARFANANAALQKGDAKALYAALENGLVDYLSDLTNAEFKGMTRPQMKQELENRGVKEETISAIDSWLEKCAFARFAPVSPSASEQKQMLADVEKLCESLNGLK